MADNVAITAGSGTSIATDDVSGVQFQKIKLDVGGDGVSVPAVSGSGNATGALRVELANNGTGVVATIGAVTAITNALPAGTNAIGKLAANSGVDIGDVDVTSLPALAAGTATIGGTFGFAATVSTDVTRPGDTAIYAANDSLSDSTSAPTAGGFTFTGAARASGGSGIITDLIVVSSNDPATLLQGELWIFDSAVTAVNDNAAFASSDADTKLLVGVIAFTLASTVAGSGTTSYAHVQNLSIGFTASGSANLRFKVKVKNAYTPANAEVLTFRLKLLQSN